MTTSAARDARLDGLRGVAVLAVIAFHLGVMPGGGRGVDVFFVLSGFLITAILMREIQNTGTVDVRAFLLRRARRLVPALALLLFAYVALAPLLIPEWAGTRWLDAALAALSVSNLAEAYTTRKSPLSPTWSLAVEWHFYLVWPLILLLLTRLRTDLAIGLIFTAWIVMSLIRYGWVAMDPTAAGAYYLTPMRVTGLLLGSAVALLPAQLRSRAPGTSALCVAIALLPVGWQGSFATTIPLVEIATAMVVARPPRILAWPPLSALGLISYGVYLWHMPFWHAVGLPKGWVSAAVVTFGSCVLAALSYFTVEKGFRSSKASAPASDVHPRTIARP